MFTDMPERIYKLQPNRALHLRGFDDLGASAALHAATANGFKVSGTFRDGADFAVLVLHDADNFFEHPKLRYLPNFDFAGLTLTFDVAYSNLMPLDSPQFPTIDWPYLDAIRPDGSTAQIRLFDHATQVGGTYAAATGSFTIVTNQIKQYDRVTLWYLNHSFDYPVPQIECSFAFAAQGAGTVHWIRVAGVQYSATEQSGDTNTDVATRVLAAVVVSPQVSATRIGSQIDLKNKIDDGSTYNVTASVAGSYTLNGVGPNTIAANLAAQIQTASYTDATVGLIATANAATIQIQAARAGVDGNAIRIYAISKNSRLIAQAGAGGSLLALTGGTSEATWRISLNFSSIGLPQVRQMWLTFAPPLVIGGQLQPIEWLANFTNWTFAGPEASRMLQVAALGSVRVEEDDSWCSYSGNWALEEGFYSGGFARRASATNDTVAIRYSCASTHDLYLGTSLYGDRGTAGIRLDGDSETDLSCQLSTASAVNTRRRIRTNVPAGEHTVLVRLKTGGVFYFDFLEAAIPGDVPDAAAAVPWMSPALDYSTDHTYKLSPARLLWNFDKLGFGGPINEYIGVFWWNERSNAGRVLPSLTVTFGGTFVPGDAIFMDIGGIAVGKSVFPDESLDTFASHFAYAVNAKYVGVFASAVGPVVTITARSAKSAYQFSFSAWADLVQGSTGTVTTSGTLTGGSVGSWDIDPALTATLNRGAREWHADFYAECKARNREVTTAASMELVNPPATFAARFPNGAPVKTDIGFGSLQSTHCAFSSEMRDYQKRVFRELADLMAAAQLTPSLQVGEFLWWFFTNWSAQNPSGGMAFYDAETATAAQTALGRPLHIFRQPTDNPNVNGGADAIFLRNRLRDHVAAISSHVRVTYPAAKFELLFPYDVNHPVPAGVHQLGGQLNRFVNFPVEWQNKATSGLDRIKMESLDFGAWSRNLDLCLTTMQFPIQLGWPKDSIRYLAPVFRSGWAWGREYLLARGLEIPIVNFWAFDHFCIYGLNPAEPKSRGRALSD